MDWLCDAGMICALFAGALVVWATISVFLDEIE